MSGDEGTRSALRLRLNDLLSCDPGSPSIAKINRPLPQAVLTY